MPQPIESLPNLGPASSQWMRDAGVHTISDLKRIGPVVAWRLVKQQQPEASLNLLWALAAGLEGMDWRSLPESVRNRLRTEVAHE